MDKHNVYIDYIDATYLIIALTIINYSTKKKYTEKLSV